MALKYYQRLCKEYAICDLSRHREGAIALRWRTEQEVLSGRGQWACGARGCSERTDLHSYEVNFAYRDGGGGPVRNDLVKASLAALILNPIPVDVVGTLKYLRQVEDLSECICGSGHAAPVTAVNARICILTRSTLRTGTAPAGPIRNDLVKVSSVAIEMPQLSPCAHCTV